MTPEQKARKIIDEKLLTSGWIIQDVKRLNSNAAVGVAVREFPTDTGPVDYALFVNGAPVGVIEAKKSEEGENITRLFRTQLRYYNIEHLRSYFSGSSSKSYGRCSKMYTKSRK